METKKKYTASQSYFYYSSRLLKPVLPQFSGFPAKFTGFLSHLAAEIANWQAAEFLTVLKICQRLFSFFIVLTYFQIYVSKS